MRPGIPLSERIRCTHHITGPTTVRGSVRGNVQINDLQATSHYVMLGARLRAGKRAKKNGHRRFFPKPCGERICVRGMVRGKKKGLPVCIR